ncbi:MAG: NAD(P)/FAD-dependent oxidoreductase [Thermoplasmatales archaeon]|nr:MAG: NAD(P)/FAD-dependent oxidoreductase [Thermoplasmatales archaeon]
MALKVDIVGGGISGLSTAMSLKERDSSINVVVHEKHKKIGYNHEGRRCGEAHSIEHLWCSKWTPTGKSFFNEITKAEVLVGKEKYEYQLQPGLAYVLNRQEFIYQLGENAKKLGAVIQTDDKIKSFSDLDGDYIIDASGFPSSIKRELGFTRSFKSITYQQTLEDSNFFVPNVIKIIYTGSIGYYWIFPRDPTKKEINLGLGVYGKTDCNLKQLLEQFKEELNIEGKINYTVGGLIPIGLQRPLRYKNILFVGDAGVGTFTMTGEGIHRALISGDVAGKCIAKGYPKKYPKIMTRYLIKWDILGKSITRMNYVFGKINPKLVLASLKHITYR